VLLGAGLTLLAQGRPWATGRLAADLGAGPLSVTGASAAPGASAMALVAAAAGIVLATAGRVGRRVAAVLVVGAGAGVLALSLPVALSPRDDLRAAAAQATGTTAGSGTGALASAAGQIATATTTVWPWVAAAGALVVLAGGVVAVLRAGRWPGPSRRYEPVAAAAADPRPPAWEALSRGEDPTDL
jgi:hypothetical protein